MRRVIILCLLFFSACTTMQVPYVDHNSIPHGSPLPIDGVWERTKVFTQNDGHALLLQSKEATAPFEIAIRQGVAYVASSNDPKMLTGNVLFRDIKKSGTNGYEGVLLYDYVMITFVPPVPYVQIEVL